MQAQAVIITQLWAGILYILGVLLLTFFKLRDIKKSFPDEAAELKVIQTYWRREWVSFGISTICLFIYVLILPELLGSTILNVRVNLFIKCISAFVGLGSQQFALSFFGVTKQVASKINIDKQVVAAKEEAKIETLTQIVTGSELKDQNV